MKHKHFKEVINQEAKAAFFLCPQTKLVVVGILRCYSAYFGQAGAFPAWVLISYSQHHSMEKAMAPHSSTLAWKNPMDGGAWWAAVHGVARSRTRLSNFTFTFHFHALEKEMATHSSVLAWRIPGTGEPGGLPSMGSHRVGHSSLSTLRVVSSAYLRLLIFPRQS